MMNLIESLFPTEFIRAFAWTLFHSLWQGALLALIAAAILLILRKHKPGIRYAILYFLMMLFPVFFAGTFLIIYNPDNVQPEEMPETLVIANQPGNEITADFAALKGNVQSTSWYTHSARLFENQAEWLVLIWFFGFLFFLLRFSGSLLYVYRLKNYQVYQVDRQWQVNLKKLSDKIGLNRPVRMAESALVHIPLTIGYLKPVILFPLGTLSGVPPQLLDTIILHELAHIMRKDYLWNIIQSVTETLFFYHPVTWWLSGLIRQEREHICDDLVIVVNHDHINYIKALTTMEELNSKSPLLASAINGSKRKLLSRVKRLISPVKPSKGFGEGIIAVILMIGLVFTLSFNALSFIPSTFDLTGRESGEMLFNLMPIQPEIPDTIIATSKSGKVKISVYTDTTSQIQQETLEQMAESMDRQARQHDKAIKEYSVQVEALGDQAEKLEQQRKVVVISESNSPDLKYIYTNPPLPGDPPIPGEEDVRVKVFSYKNDSIDTLIFIRQGEPFGFENMEEMEWNAKEMEDLMRDHERELQEFEWSADAMKDHQMEIEIENEFGPGPRMAPAEKIIRQELRDDGLTVRGKKYVVELDSKAMYINGEKQPKEIYRKYNKLVESLEGVNFEGDENYKIIF